MANKKWRNFAPTSSHWGGVAHTLDAGVEVFVDVFAPMGEVV
jgi:hypothetical protein